MQYLILIIIK